MLNRTVNNHWDATTALTRLQNFSQQIMSQTESAFNIEPLVNQMKYLGRDFFIKASQPQYRSFLTSDERLDLEKTFSNLADWFQLDCKHNHPVRQHTATLQVLVSITKSFNNTHICINCIIFYLIPGCSSEDSSLHHFQNKS